MIVQNTHLGNNLKIGTSNGSATYNFKKIHFHATDTQLMPERIFEMSKKGEKVMLHKMN